MVLQLPLSGTMLPVTVLTMVLHPALDKSGPFRYTLGAHVLLIPACALLPRAHLPRRAVLTDSEPLMAPPKARS